MLNSNGAASTATSTRLERHSPTLKVHSIIAVRPGAPPDHRTDGLVSFESAHITGAVSEKVVAAGHLCQDHAEVIGEVRRILSEHAAVD